MITTIKDTMMRPPKRLCIRYVCPNCGHRQVIKNDDDPICKKCHSVMEPVKVIIK